MKSPIVLVSLLLILQLVPSSPAADGPRRPVTSLPSFVAFLSSPSYHVHAPSNPATPTFAGWLSTNDLPSPSGLTAPPTTLEPLSASYPALPAGNHPPQAGNPPIPSANPPVLLDDHSYADNTPLDARMTTSLASNSK